MQRLWTITHYRGHKDSPASAVSDVANAKTEYLGSNTVETHTLSILEPDVRQAVSHQAERLLV